MISGSWTTHEEFLVTTMVTRLKLVRLDQLRAIWAHAPCGPPQLLLKEALLRQQWAVQCFRVNLHPALKPAAPVLRLRAGDLIPEDLRPHSQTLRSRWKLPAIPTTVYVPSRQAANLLGSSSSGLPSVEHRDHDALLTDAFVHHLRLRPNEICHWEGEQMRSPGGYKVKDPDALLKRDGQPYGVVESGGAYSANHLRELCEYASERQLTLEVW